MYCSTPKLLLDQLVTRCQKTRVQGSGLATSLCHPRNLKDPGKGASLAKIAT